MSKKDLEIVKDEEPFVEAATDETDLNVFFQWDDLSQRLAASGMMNPPWFRAVGLDDGELLLFSSIPAKVPEDADKEEHAESRWDAGQIAKIIGPTKGLIDKLLDSSGAETAEIAVTLVAECLMELPESFKLKRPFCIGEKTVLDVGDSYPAPWRLAERGVDGIRREELVKAYINLCLPKRVRDMVHTGALCMAVPETDFMVVSGSEKGSAERATMVDHPRADAAGDDRNFGEGFSTDSEKK